VTASERSPSLSIRATLARIDAELADARLRRQHLDGEWAHAMYTAGCRRPRRPTDISASRARMDALIVELEERREQLIGTASDAPAPSATPPSADDDLPSF
jgi:hypothetical protein